MPPQFIALMRCLEAAFDREDLFDEEIAAIGEITIGWDGGPYPIVTVAYGCKEVYVMDPVSEAPYAYWTNDFDQLKADREAEEAAARASGDGV